MFFSVIVPVYNVQSYLPECIKSVLQQSFVDFQLVLVDDGSTDGSGKLCDGYAATDARIQVIHQKNAGLASARNKGLSRATGEYILFLDSDDFYPRPDFLEQLKEAAPVPVICFNYARYTDALASRLIADPGNICSLPSDERKRALVESGAYTSSACLKAVHRSLFETYGLRFEPGVLSEDVEWNAKLLAVAPDIVFLSEPCYAYRIRNDSITHTVSKKHVVDLCNIVERLARQDISAMTSATQEAFRGYIAFQYATLIINSHICTPDADEALRARVKKSRALLEYDLCPQVRLIKRVSRILGYSLTGVLLTMYFKFMSRQNERR